MEQRLSNADFFAELESHPDLLSHFKRLLLIAKSTGADAIIRADDAEEAVTMELRSLGKDVLTNWAVTQEEQSAMNLKSSIREVKPHSKKNSIGTLVTEKLK